MRVKDLKNKEVKAIRIDNIFIDNAKIIEKFEDKIKHEQDLSIVSKEREGNFLHYKLKTSKEKTFKIFMGNKTEESCLKICKEDCDKIIDYKMENGFLIAKVIGSSIDFKLRLNNENMAKVMPGKVVFRSKDYVFIADNGYKIYGNLITKGMLTEKGFKNQNVEYVLED